MGAPFAYLRGLTGLSRAMSRRFSREKFPCGVKFAEHRRLYERASNMAFPDRFRQRAQNVWNEKIPQEISK